MNNELPEEEISPETLRRAIKAFKKRLKLARLDDESGLGHGSIDKGHGSGIVAVRPPDRYPQAVWDKLFADYAKKYPELAAKFEDAAAGKLSVDLDEILPRD